MEDSFFFEIVVIFLLSIGVTLVCSKAKLPATVGFLLTGVLFGPSSPVAIVVEQGSLSKIAEIGVAMLLFTIGMELSGDALSRLKRPVFLGGSLQLGLTILVIAGLAMPFGYGFRGGIFWGCLAALSSSAIVLRIMQEKGTTSTPAGRLSLAILVFQDIMVAPMLLVVPLLAGTLEIDPAAMAIPMLKVAGTLGGVVLLAHFGLDRLMAAVVRTRTREILLLTNLGLCLGMALLTEHLGLSLSLGAFLAGLLLARSQYSMSVISGILPYRDVFMSLFFISVGMLLDWDFFLAHAFAIVACAIVFVTLKALLTLPSVLIQAYPLKTAIVTSLSLAQVGEFSFVLSASALSAGLIDEAGAQAFLAVSVFSMMLTPGLIAIAPKVADAVVARLPGKRPVQPEETVQPDCDLNDHLIIVGFGLSGKHLAHAAKESSIPYTILEMNPETVKRFRGREPISHGDASQPVVLEHLGIARARVMAIVISDPSALRSITIEARRLNPDVYIVARSRFVTEISPLLELGASYVIAEEFETSIEVFSRVLAQFMVPIQEVDALAARFRSENYRTLRRQVVNVENLDSLAKRLPDMGVQAMRVGGDSPLLGVSLVNSGLRNTYGVSVVAIHRDGDTRANVDPGERFEAGDVVYLFGKTDKLFAVKPVFGTVTAPPPAGGAAPAAA
ncbi:MAG: cation:proton antiporter [Desulfovibrio sp.]|jgi:CPA2 family monovalent cation:H+ antiporter-2|nr:cation:proton antiporter [Desulfovibrio sp.]